MAKRRANPDVLSGTTSALRNIEKIVDNHDDPELMNFLVNRVRIELQEAKRRGRPRKTRNGIGVEIASYAMVHGVDAAAKAYNVKPRTVVDHLAEFEAAINGAN